MPIQLDDYLFYIGGIRPDSDYSFATKIHAIVEHRRQPRRFPYFTPPRSYHSLCGTARRWLGSSNYRTHTDETIDTHEIDCKTCRRMLDKYLGHFDLSSPDWEV